jgi:sec-independent protein translocase protein TatC
VTDDIEDKPQPLLEHLMELRNRLMWAIGAFFIAFLLCFAFAKPLFNVLVEPFTWAVDWAGLSDRKIELIYTAPQEFFFTRSRSACFGGLVLAFPVIASQLYKFVAPGLYKNERGAFLPLSRRHAGAVPARRGAGLFPDSFRWRCGSSCRWNRTGSGD